MLFLQISAGGLCDWGILLVISLAFQGNKASTVFYGTAFFKNSKAVSSIRYNLLKLFNYLQVTKRLFLIISINYM